MKDITETTLEDYIPKKALKEILAVLRYGELKHSRYKWKKSTTLGQNVVHAYRHLKDYEERLLDLDSNLSNMAHAAVRCMFALHHEINYTKRRLKNDKK